jgi:anti-sigma factor RsiW
MKNPDSEVDGMDRLDKVIQYFDGELSEAEAAEFEQQLQRDEACQAEFVALKRVDLLLADAAVVAPSPDFVARFETRLEQRITRRRNMIGVSVIGLIMALATALLVWSWADWGLTLLSLTDGPGLQQVAVDALQSLVTGAGVVFRVISLLSSTMLRLINHPIFWGYACLVAGLVALWTQTLRWINQSRASIA